MNSFWKYLAEIGFSISLLANAILFVPQALKLYRAKTAKGVSFLTFFGFNIIQTFTAIHAYLTSDWILLMGSVLALFTCAIVTTLAYIYRKH
jgi:MtN3 and saliva related transmembrane protein